MADSIEVMGVVLDCLTAKEAMLRAMQFMENDLVDTIEILSMKDLMNGREDTKWQDLVNECGLVMPGEAEILKAADAGGGNVERETADHVFIKLFLKYLQNKNRIFLDYFLSMLEDLELLNCSYRLHKKPYQQKHY